MKTFFVSKMVFDFSNVVIVGLDSYWGSPYRTPNVILKYMFTLSIAVNPRRWRKSLNISAKYVKVKFCKICFFFLVTLSILEEGRNGLNWQHLSLSANWSTVLHKNLDTFVFENFCSPKFGCFPNTRGKKGRDELLPRRFSLNWWTIWHKKPINIISKKFYFSCLWIKRHLYRFFVSTFVSWWPKLVEC